MAEKNTVCRSGGRSAENRFDVVAEAHVEHAIGFIEHDHAHLVEPQRAALEVIHDAPRRADDDLRAFAQPAQLPVVGLSAVDRQLAHAAFEERQLGDLLGHLHGQLARRAQDQHLRRAQRRVDPLDRRDREGGGLPRAGLRLADDVGAGQQLRNRLRLNRRRFLESHLADGLEDLRRQAEIREQFLLHRDS